MATPEQLFNAGMTFLKQRDVQQAVALASNAVLSFPDHADLWELLGVCQFHANDFAEACEALEEASLRKPLDVGARYCLAGAYAATGRWELAVFLYRMMADDERAPICLLPKIAARLGQMFEHVEALQVCHTIVRREPDHHGAHFGIAYYLRQLGEPLEKIVNNLARAHELAPEVPLYRIALASLMQELGDTDAAYDLLQDVSLDSLGCPCLLKRMALLLPITGDDARAQECSRRLRELEKSDDLEGQKE